MNRYVDVDARSETRARRRFVREAVLFTPFLVVETEGLLFLVPTGDRTHDRFFVVRRRPELRALPRALERLAGAGVEVARTTFVDVGANIGTTTLAAVRAGFSSVLACEPVPWNVRLLRVNLALNDAEHAVRVLELALSNRTGTAAFDLGPDLRSMGGRLAEGGAAKGPTRKVRLTRLDDLVADGIIDAAEVGFLWLDVDGHESRVLEGSRLVLERGIPLVFELSPRLLARTATLDALADLVAAYYTHVLDLRRRAAEFRPVAAVREINASLRDGQVTDLLACRLPTA